MDLSLSETDVLYGWICRYSMVVALTVQLYDYLSTLDDEIRLVWPRGLSSSNLIYFGNRYLPFFSASMAIYCLIIERDADGCYISVVLLTCISTIGMLWAEFTLLLRTDAIWGRTWTVRMLLAVLYICLSFGFVFFVIKHILSVTVIPSSDGCLYWLRERDFIAVCFFAIFDFATVVLLLIKISADSVSLTTFVPMMRAIYEDGLVYVCIISVWTIINLVLSARAPPLLTDSFIVLEGVLINVLCARMMLHMREAHETLVSPTLEKLRLLDCESTLSV